MDLVDAAKNLSLDELGDAITHVSLHTAYPGLSGTSEVTGGSPAYTREAVTWNAASGGSMAASAALDFNVPAGTTVAWAGLWSASTSGTFYGNVPLGPVGDPKLSIAIASTNVFAAVAHGFANTQTIAMSKTLGALPTGVTDGQIVFVRDTATDSFKIALTSGGTEIDITASGNAMVRAVTSETFGGQGTYSITNLTLNLA